MIDIVQRMKVLYDWYSRQEVQYEIIKFTYNREFAVLLPWFFHDNDGKFNDNIRYLRCHNTEHFSYLLTEGIRMFEKNFPYQLYYSLAKYRDGIPKFTMNLSKRNTEDWKNNHYKDMVSYDFLIDIDAKSFDNIYMALETAKEIKKLFDSYSLIYELRFSGRGFHFIIRNDLACQNINYSMDINADNTIYLFYSQFAKFLNIIYSDMVDYRIYDSRRVVKCPYTLANYEDKITLCYPFLSDDEFQCFNLDDADLKYFARNKIKNRGTFLFNYKENLRNDLTFNEGFVKSFRCNNDKLIQIFKYIEDRSMLMSRKTKKEAKI